MIIALFLKTRNDRWVENALDAIALTSHMLGYTIRGGYVNPFTNPSGEIKTEKFHCVSTRNGYCTFKWRDLEMSWHTNSRRKIFLNRKMKKKERAEMLKECLTSLEKK